MRVYSCSFLGKQILKQRMWVWEGFRENGLDLKAPVQIKQVRVVEASCSANKGVSHPTVVREST